MPGIWPSGSSLSTCSASGMSEGTSGASPLEEQMDDVRAVMRACGSWRAALVAAAEACGLAAMFAASHPASKLMKL